VAAVLVLNTPDDGRLRPKHVEWPCRNKTCTVLHQVGVSFDLSYDARKHKIKIYIYEFHYLYQIGVLLLIVYKTNEYMYWEYNTITSILLKTSLQESLGLVLVILHLHYKDQPVNFM